MADQLIDLPLSGVALTACNPPRIRYPFRNNPVTPDIYARVTERDFAVSAGYFDNNGRLATRTSYTNLLTYSNDFANAAWTKNASTISAAQLANPWDGTVNGSKIVEAATTDFHYISHAVTLAAVVNVLWGVFRAGERAWVELAVVDSGAAEARSYFDLTNGLVGSTSGAKFSASGITSVGNGWYICYVSTIAVAAGSGSAFAITATANGGNSYAGDVAKGIYCAQMQMQTGSVAGPLIPTTSATVTVSVPDTDAIANSTLAASNRLDSFGFLVAESDPAQADALIAKFTRAYARVPAAQIVPSSKYFTRPVMHDVFIASTAWAVSFDDLQAFSHVFTSRKTVSSVGALMLGTIAVPQTFGSLPSDTITFTDSAATGVGFAMNAAASSVEATLNGVYAATVNKFTAASIGGALVISWTNGTGYIKSIVTAATLATMSGFPGAVATGAIVSVTFTATQANNEAPNKNPSLRVINCTGHGGVVGDRVVFWNGDKIVAKSILMATGGANDYSVLASDVDGKDIVITTCGMSSDAATCYVNGAKVCTTRRTTNFYLPGYSTGITTYADIPTLTLYSDPLSWLGRIIAVPTGWAAIEVSDVTQWMGAILQQDKLEIQMDDALDTVTP